MVVWLNLVDAENFQIPLENEYSLIFGLAHALGKERSEDLAEAGIVELMADSELNENGLIDIVHTTNENVDEKELNAFTGKVVLEGLEEN